MYFTVTNPTCGPGYKVSEAIKNEFVPVVHSFLLGSCYTSNRSHTFNLRIVALILFDLDTTGAYYTLIERGEPLLVNSIYLALKAFYFLLSLYRQS